MTAEQTLQSEIQDAKRWIECTQEENTYKRDLKIRIDLINLGFRKYEKSRYSYLRTNRSPDKSNNR